jgi:hypothetical protein
VTDQEIRDAVKNYILGTVEADNGDCLHEMIILDDLPDDEFDDAMDRAYVFYRRAKISVTFGDE